MRQLKKSQRQGTGFPWPLILLGLAGVGWNWVAGLPLAKVGRVVPADGGSAGYSTGWTVGQHSWLLLDLGDRLTI